MRLRKNIQKTLSSALMVGTLALGMVAPVFAADLTNASVTLGDSRPAQTAVNYAIRFNPGTSGTIRCITFEFVQKTGGNIPAGAIASEPATGLNTTAVPSATTTSGLTNGNWLFTSTAANSGKLEYGTGDTVTTATTINIALAAMVNPTTQGTYYLRLTTWGTNCTTGLLDQSVVAFAAINGVVVSATVDPIFNFTVAGIAPAATWKTGETAVSTGCDYAGGNLTFPKPLVLETDYTCAHQLTVETNAAGGYTVTLKGFGIGSPYTTGNFLKSNASRSITDITGTGTTPGAWSTGAAEAFGWSTDDTTLGTGTAGRFAGTNLWAKVPLTANPEEIMYNNNVLGSDVNKIGYRLRIFGQTRAGTYQGTAIYTATPIF